MKCKVSSSALMQRLQALSRVIATKNTAQILSCFLLEWDKERLSVTASDGEIRLKSWMPIEDSEGDGTICIDTRILLEGVKGLPDQQVEFDINPGSEEVSVDYGIGKFSFIGQRGDLYPVPLPMADETWVMETDSAQLLRKIGKTLFATSQDEFRPVMTGVYFELSEDSLNTVASDGHKLILIHEMNRPSEEKRSFIMSRKTGYLLKGLLSGVSGSVKMEFDREKIRISMEGYELDSRHIQGKFPNYQAVIPKKNSCKVHLDRASFLSVIRRVSCFSNDDSNLVKLVFENGRLQVSAQDINFSVSGNESIPCDYEGEPMTIGFKAVFLMELLGNLESPEVVLELGSPAQAALFLPSVNQEEEELTQLLMPMSVVD